ncbi:MAG: 16S rRNA (guanine(966)-N(2))-methyltransferase RsmD [Acidiferrobacterales bacterium]
MSGFRKKSRSRGRNHASRGAHRNYPGALRIIAGTWRRRRLLVPDGPDVRPTPDRVRETLFNWLRSDLSGARCVDLFAGTGALCLEALSRGASRVVMVERAPEAVACLRDNVAELGADGAHVVEADAVDYLMGPPETFDIVFIDPPFHSDLIARSSELVDTRGWIEPGALVYIESPREMAQLPIPESWEVIRGQNAGQVGYHLARKRR